MIQKALALCYPPGAIVPSPDTLHYTLGEHPSHLIWTQGRRPFYDTQVNALTNREISLSHDDRLECITLETATICAFLPPPDTAFALPPLSEAEMSEAQQLEHADLSDNGKAYTPPTQQQLYHHNSTLTRQGEPNQVSQEYDLIQEETPPRASHVTHVNDSCHGKRVMPHMEESCRTVEQLAICQSIPLCKLQLNSSGVHVCVHVRVRVCAFVRVRVCVCVCLRR